MKKNEVDYSEKTPVLEKVVETIATGVDRTISTGQKISYNFEEREWTVKELKKSIINSGKKTFDAGLKTFAAGLTLSGLMVYAIGKGVYNLEKKMGEDDPEREQRYKLNMKQYYSEKYQLIRDHLILH
jgi:hypothetical protein